MDTLTVKACVSNFVQKYLKSIEDLLKAKFDAEKKIKSHRHKLETTFEIFYRYRIACKDR